ncbi:MAG: hypothetical protein J6V38_06915 [Kiritimatiellae bacterium]|nr:hypothetical protein [Kiritimatiellia bacterium]
MKTPVLIIAASILTATCALAKSDVVYDAAKRTVSFDVVSTDCGVDTEIEFLFVGPNSDHDYESMFKTVAPVSEIADAFAKAGFPLGSPMSTDGCRFWATGDEVIMEPAFTNLVKDLRSKNQPRMIFTGGSRNAKGEADAAKEMPEAIFALYNLSQSLILFDDFFDQSATYGRFKVAQKIPAGEKRRITFKYVSDTAHRKETVKIGDTNLVELANHLKAKSAGASLDILCDFDPKTTLKSARDAARLLQMLDSRKIKINGVKEGQLYYKAYLPLEKWRDRKERLAQPPEVRFAADGSISVTEIKEDWSDENSLDPKLTPVEKRYADPQAAASAVDAVASKVFTVFFYASENSEIGRIFEFRKKLKTPKLNIYVFTE